MKTIQLILVGMFLAVCSVRAQVPPDLSVLTNHAALVSYVFKKVEGVMVSFHPQASARGHDTSAFYQYTNKVKTLEGIAAMITNQWWSLPVVDTNAPISVQVQFFDTSDENTARGYGNGNGEKVGYQRVLFEGYNGGTPRRSPDSGKWVLPDYAQEIQMRLTYRVFIPMTNIASAHFVYTNNYGGYSSFDMESEYGKGFWFYPDYAGQGILVLTTVIHESDNFYRFKETAYNLGAGGVEVPITGVLVRALVEDSEDFRSLTDPTSLDISVYSYNGYGKVPLLITTYNADAPIVFLSVHTLTQHATSFLFENQADGQRTTITVPADATGLKIGMPKGVWHIIPQGLNLKADSGGCCGGGKG